MDSFKTNISFYQENRIFLSRNYETINEFSKYYSTTYSEKEKSKQIYLLVLYELKASIIEGNFIQFTHLSKIFSFIIDCEKFEELASNSHEDIYPFKGTNIIILACKYNRFNILKYIFLNYSTIYKHLFYNEEKVLLPDDEDENFHNAFYYSIRTGDPELVKLLIEEWPGNYLNANLKELDTLLSKAYEELKLKNVLLSEEMEIFIEEKLINLRFFSTTSDQNNKLSLPNINERMALLIELITTLKSDSDINEFLFKLKYVILNINTLKRLIKVTYSKVPWEEMEFCLGCFVLSFMRENEMNLYFRAVFSKKQILKHLANFASGLERIKDEIAEYEINALSALPKISRKSNTSQIIKLNPEYEELFRDYQVVCDIYYLYRISTYISLALSADAKKREGQLTISRSLQVIGQCLKNTLESPNLSSYMSDLLLLLLPKNTRKLATDLRNSSSHVQSLNKRIESQQNAKATFYEDIQYGLRKIGKVIMNIIFDHKLKTIKGVLETIALCSNLNEVEEIIALFNIETLNSMMPANLKLTEYKKVRDSVEKLKRAIPYKTKEEEEIFEKIDEILDAENNKSSDKKEGSYSLGISELNYFRKTLNKRINEQIHRTIKFVCINALENLAGKTINPQTLKYIADMTIRIMAINELKRESKHMESAKMEATSLDAVKRDAKIFEAIQAAVLEIVCIAEIHLDNVPWVNELRRQLKEIRNVDEKQTDNCATKDEYVKQLSVKISDLKSILVKQKFDNLSSASVADGNNAQVISALEMIVLDILSILGQLDNLLEANYFFLDQSIPHLIGENLRNHLTQYSTVTYILPSDSVTVLISNAKIIAEKVNKNSRRIGKYVEDEPAKLRSKINRELEVMTLQKKMFDALEAGDFEILKSCIAQGADIHSRNRDNWSTLHAAAKGGNVSIVQFLLEQKVKTDAKSVKQQNALHIAVINGNVSVVEHFIEQKYYSLKDTDETNKTALHLAALNNHKSIIEILLKHNADCTARDKTGGTPLHLAVQQNHLEAVQALMEQEKSVDGNKMLGGFTSLHLAADLGSLEVAHYLLSRGANVNAISDGKATPLHLAALNGYAEITKALIENKCEVNVKTWDGCTPLLHAAEYGSNEIVDILLKNGADPNIFESSNYGPIHHATKDGNVEMLEALLKHNAKTDVMNGEGKSPLEYAIDFGSLEIVKILHKHGVNLKGRKQCSSLHVAVMKGHLDIVEYLIEQKVDVNAKDSIGSIPLHYAASKGRDDIVSMLIKNNAKINSQSHKNGFTPLLAALGSCIEGIDDLPYQIKKIVEHVRFFKAMDKEESKSSLPPQYENVIDILLKNGADVNVTTTAGTSTLHFAAIGGKCSFANMLLERNASVNMQCNQGYTPLHIAAMFGHNPIVELLLANKAKINFIGPAQYSPLHLAVEFSHKDTVELLLANKANVNDTNREGWTPVGISLKEGRVDILKMLLESGADVNENKEKNLMLSIAKGSAEAFKLLLERTVMNTKIMGNLLHFGIARNNLEAINALIELGIDVNKGKKGKPPLLHAVAENQDKTVEILLKNGANVNAVMKPEELTGLHLASMVDNGRMIDVLLSHGINVNARNRYGSTALHLAVATGCLSNVQRLFPLTKMNINDQGTNDFTLLHVATQGGSLEITKFLVEKGADLHIKATNEAKPIHIAVKGGHLDIVKYLSEQGVDINKELGIFDRSLLHYAALMNRIDIAEFLIQKGADVNAKDSCGITPLYVAADTASPELVSILLENGAMYNLGDVSDRKPFDVCEDECIRSILYLIERLFEAVKHNNLTQVENCINTGALINVHNADNMTPLHFTSWKGYDDIANFLLEHGANPNAAGRKGMTPLHFAAKFGHRKVCLHLLSHGATYNILNESRKTPLDLSEQKDVKELFMIIHSCFNKVSNKNVTVLSDLQKLESVHLVKALMSTRNTNGKTLMATAVSCQFPRLDELKASLLYDLPNALIVAESLCDGEEYDRALEIFKNTLDIRRKILGKDYIDTLKVQADVAKVLYRQHKYEEALKIYTDVYERQKRLVGEHGREALNTRSFLALVMYRQGKNDEALAIFDEVLAQQEKILTMDDEDLLCTLIHRAMVLMTQGKNAEALKINNKVLQYRRKVLGENHPETLTIQNNIGMVIKNLGSYEEALYTFRKVYEKRKSVIGPNHSETLRTFHNIISVLEAQKKHDEALQAYMDLLKTQEEQLGPEHVDTLNTQQSLAKLHAQQGKTISALKIYSKYLPVMRMKLGLNHPNVITSENIIQAIKKGFGYGNIELDEVMNNLNKEARSAVCRDELVTVRTYIKNGLGVNDQDDEGRTLLHYACDNAGPGLVKMLLDYGANVTCRTKIKGYTTLHYAADRGLEEVGKMLLARVKRDELVQFVNAKTSGGNTALHVAAKCGNYEFVWLLLVNGAIFDAKNKEGRMPAHLSQRGEIIDLLEIIGSMFEYARTGDAELVRIMQIVKKEQLMLFTSVRNHEDKTIAQVAIMNKRPEIAKEILKAVKTLT